MERITGWITKDEVLKRTGATPAQLQRWHTEIFAYSNESLYERRGNGRGSITWYHPLTVSIVQRIIEIKTQGQRDFVFWRWQLWLEDFPIDVSRDSIHAIEQIMKDVALPEGRDTLEIIEKALGYVHLEDPGSLMGHVQRKIKNEADLHSFLVWIMYTAIGDTPIAGWNDVVDAEDPLDMIWPPENHPHPTLGELFARTMGAPDDWAKTNPIQEGFSYIGLLQILKEADKEEWEQARHDWQPIVRLLPFVPLFEKMSKTAPIRQIADLYYDAHERALLTGIMIQARRSNMKDDLETALEALNNLASTLETLTNSEIPEMVSSQ